MEHDYLLSNPYYVKALEYIKEHNLFAYEPGKYVIDGDNLWLNINDSVLKTQKEARLEVHDRYIDIQIPLSAPETFGVARRSDCSQPVGEMDREKDILFFADPVRKQRPSMRGNPSLSPRTRPTLRSSRRTVSPIRSMMTADSSSERPSSR